MFLLRQFPEPRRLLPLPGNESYRRRFYSRWGKEHCIVLAASRRIELPPHTQRLSVKAVMRGIEQYELGGRYLRLDRHSYLIVNDDRTYSSRIAADRAVETFSVFFAPGFAERVAPAILDQSCDPLAQDGDPEPAMPEFSEHLRPHDRLVTPVLRRIRDEVRRGVPAEGWFEEQLVLLLEAMVKSQRRINLEIADLPFTRAVTRREVFRRIALATDYLHGNFRRNIRIDELARVAHLSKFHFIKLFDRVHGRTPHAFLQRKRAAVAAGLLETTRLPQLEIASLAGFNCRATMYRELRRLAGQSGRAIRADGRFPRGAAGGLEWPEG